MRTNLFSRFVGNHFYRGRVCGKSVPKEVREILRNFSAVAEEV